MAAGCFGYRLPSGDATTDAPGDPSADNRDVRDVRDTIDIEGFEGSDITPLDTPCPPDELDCGTGCTNILKDRLNCGGCGAACAGVLEQCIDGSCQCVPPFILCGGECVDPRVDPLNCGACDSACTYPAYCVSPGICTCPSLGYSILMCDGICVNIYSDSYNCGACGTACGPGTYCLGYGSCGATCLYYGYTLCLDEYGEGGCTDLQTDALNCGSCNNACLVVPHAYATCAASVCSYACFPGWGNANGEDEDGCECILTSSAERCDGIDNDCNGQADDGVGFECAMGDREVCNLTDEGCMGWRRCQDNCLWGRCESPDWECPIPGETRPCEGLDGCSGVQTCSDSCTWSACDASGAVCETGATDTSCYAEGTDCPGNRTCLEGCTWSECRGNCHDPLPNCCTDGCRNLAVDPNNCGTCGNRCGLGFKCCSGVCQACCSNTDCPAALPACVGGRCVECSTDYECIYKSGTPRCCDETCHACCQDAHCTIGCYGTAQACNTFTEAAACNAQSGCAYYAEPTCFQGTTTNCGYLTDHTACRDCGCTWYNYAKVCYGAPICGSLTAEADCTACTCTWDQDYCAGTSAACTSFTDEAACEAQAGCSWSSASCIDYICQ